MSKPMRSNVQYSFLTCQTGKKTEQIKVLSEWEILMDKANDLFANKSYVLAQEEYEGCINYLLIYLLICLEKDPEGAISALTVSHLNIVEMHIIMGEYDLSSKRLEEVLLFSMKLYLQHPMNYRIQTATIRSIHHIMLEWAKLVRDHKLELSAIEINRYYSQKEIIFAGFQTTYH